MKRVTIGLVLTLTLLVDLFIQPYLPELLRSNIFLIAIILTLLFGETRTALLAAVVGGFLADLISPLPFGTTLLSLLGMLSIIRWASRSRVTNRSFIAYMALTGLGVTAFSLLTLGLSYGLRILDSTAIVPLVQMSWLITNAEHLGIGLGLALLAYIFVRLSGRSYTTLASHEF